MAEPVAALLRRSIGHLADEVPASYRLVLDRLGPLVVALEVDGEQFTLRGGPRLEVSDGSESDGGPRITTSRAAILDVLDARIGLHDAVQAGAVTVDGTLDDMLQVHDTLLAYVHAAVRAPALPGLLIALREEVP
ncbi:SCP-2 sterol transfer family protein [Mycobacterium aquaticum]|uniref:SCP-2 sterol transfer family protein n=1 Tax=Mycobacterium aquaticum TaxID=1927124 RepID=A0A1X0A5X5_9MYCO|nr:SCP-2 sterol transfer family protein [Mycobacterium aquaticum]ORA25481.1 SCP-2 sterol transfer family protein [Mycobacterium aquaticum]